MLILFDQGTPVPLRPCLQGHTVKTAAQQCWSTLANGDLLRTAELFAGWNLLCAMDDGKHVNLIGLDVVDDSKGSLQHLPDLGDTELCDLAP